MNAIINYKETKLNDDIIHHLINEELVEIAGLDYLTATVWLEQEQDAFAIITEQAECVKVFNADLLPWEYDIDTAMLSDAITKGEINLQESEGLILAYIPRP